MLVINMAGGLSQLESWDPKPGTPTGGPFRAIPTSVPGLHISELLPRTARIMHHLALIRSINTHEDDHGKGDYIMSTGRRKTPAQDYPLLGAVVAKALENEESALPGNIVITPGGAGRAADSAYLGPKYASVVLGNGKPPQFSQPPDGNEGRFSLRQRSAAKESTTDLPCGDAPRRPMPIRNRTNRRLS
jgi:hypothetical protein